MKCPWGCGWEGEPSEYDEHLKECPSRKGAGEAYAVVSAEKGIILHHRQFQNVGECFYCGGILFSYRDTILNLDLLSKEDREKARGMVAEGAQLDRLMEEFPDGFAIEEMDTTICEKCGKEESYPLRGGP